ncbi:MAG: hypothetical protein ACLT98_07895 [Eggerthellaceae bacterium]
MDANSAGAGSAGRRCVVAKRRSMLAAQETAFAQSLGMQPVGSFVSSPIKPAGAHARQPERVRPFNLPRI